MTLDVARRRLESQRLLGPAFDTPADVVRWFGAVQAQDYAGAKWALAQRLDGATDADVERAFQEGAILRTHVLRPTWHFVAPDDIRWLLALTAPRIEALSATYKRQLEISDAIVRKSQAVLSKALRGGRFLTRDEIAQALARAGITARGPRLALIVMGAEIAGLICSGPRRGKQFTYALLEERAPKAPVIDRDTALARLAERYFTSHGPATLHDFGWWSGLTMPDARAGAALLGSRLERRNTDGKTLWFMAGPRARARAKTTLQLLPNYDEHLVAYKDHGFTFDPGLLAGRKLPLGTLGSHVVTLNGRVIGGWRRVAGARLEVTLLTELDSAARRALDAAVAHYGRFVGLPATLVVKTVAARRRRV